MKRSESYYHMAVSARRSMAKALFTSSNIAQAVHEAAALGYRHYRIVQPAPFDLSDTEAAQALEEWLDSEEFHYIWRPTFVAQDPLRPSLVTEYPELVITW